MRPRLATATLCALAAVSTATLSGCGLDATGSGPEANLQGTSNSSSAAVNKPTSGSAGATPSASAKPSSQPSSQSATPSTSGAPVTSESAQPVPTASAIPGDSVGPLAPQKETGQPGNGTLKKPTTNQAAAPSENAVDPEYMSGTSTAVDCPGGSATVSQAHAVVSLTEDCSRLVVSGNGAVVHAGAVEHIVVTGDSVTVTAGDAGKVEFRGTGGVVLYGGELPTRVDNGKNNMMVPTSAME